MNGKTQFYVISDRESSIRRDMTEIYNALVEKGYDPISQIVGYILAEDPTYITGHKNARNLMTAIDRDDLLRVLVESYIRKGE
ncbi:MAG: IreB family regulatory phosphoprotein [Oscillospiraceae bacterium]|nr:IreB family regulatory phosphoprotein [Oscillospiraceae bacterium]